MKKVVFICRGNMFRSPIAAALYNKLATDGSIAEAYGTAVAQEGRAGRFLTSYGGGMDKEIAYLQKEGMDLSNDFCKQVTPAVLEGVSKIIMMSEKEFIPEWLKHYEYEYWDIENPEILTQQKIESVYQLLKQKVTHLISELSQ